MKSRASVLNDDNCGLSLNNCTIAPDKSTRKPLRMLRCFRFAKLTILSKYSMLKIQFTVNMSNHFKQGGSIFGGLVISLEEMRIDERLTPNNQRRSDRIIQSRVKKDVVVKTFSNLGSVGRIDDSSNYKIGCITYYESI